MGSGSPLFKRNQSLLARSYRGLVENKTYIIEGLYTDDVPFFATNNQSVWRLGLGCRAGSLGLLALRAVGPKSLEVFLSLNISIEDLGSRV